MAYNYKDAICHICGELVFGGEGNFVNFPPPGVVVHKETCYQVWKDRNANGKKKAKAKRELKALKQSQPTLFD